MCVAGEGRVRCKAEPCGEVTDQKRDTLDGRQTVLLRRKYKIPEALHKRKLTSFCVPCRNERTQIHTHV